MTDEIVDPEDARAELARLTHALRGEVKKRVRLGGARAPKSEPAGASERAGAPPVAPSPERHRSPQNAAPAASAEDVRAQAAGAATLDELRAAVARCEACSLCKTRTQTVFQDGQGSSGILFVGEAPGAEEDRTGTPFVGRAGALLTDIVTKGMGLARQDVWIANVLKCRPPENRDPTPAEKATCTPWLDRQIELLGPRLVIPLGRHAASHLLGYDAPLSHMRGRVHTVRGRTLVPTFHPAYLLRSPGEKKECWKDIQIAMEVAGLPRPPRSDGP